MKKLCLLLMLLFPAFVQAQVPSLGNQIKIATEVYQEIPEDLRRPELYALAQSQNVQYYAQNVSHSNPTGTPLSACGNITVSGTYYLTGDVSSVGTCFNVLATSGVIVNLNGHTVTYGSSSQTKIVAGFLQIACYETLWTSGGIESTTGACNSSSTFDGPTIYGGSIVQGCTPITTCLPQDSNGVFCDSFFSGNGACLSGPIVYSVNFTWGAGNSLAISANYGNDTVPGGGIIHDNVFTNEKTGPTCAAVPCRESLQGSSVVLGNATSTTSPFSYYNNSCSGGTQSCGVMIDAPGVTFSSNGPMNGGNCTNEYTNDFAIYAWGPGATVQNNTIGTNPPAACQYQRGISVDLVEYSGEGAEYTISGNTVDVIGSTENAEYGGCSIGGQYAFQVDDGGGPAYFTTNTGRGHSDACAGTGLRLTQLGAGIHSAGNSWFGILESGAALTPSAEFPVTPLYIDGDPSYPAYVSIGDSFTGDGSIVAVDYNGSGPVYLDQCTFNSGSNPTNFVTMSFWNGGADSTKTYLIDCAFNGLAVPTLTNMQVGNGSPYDLAQYFVQWSYSVHVTGAVSGNPISGATLGVVASAAAGSGVECIAITDSSGNASCPFSYTPPTTVSNSALIQFDMKNSTTVAQINTNHNPHEVTVTKSGCTTYGPNALTITGTISGAGITLGGC